MPPKYSHVKKRPSSGVKPKRPNKPTFRDAPSPHADRALSPAAQLENTISRILLARYDQDVARLFSAHLFTAALVHLPTLALRIVGLGGPGWLGTAAASDGVKDFFRALIGVELRQAGERVATKSVLWSYTALRDFALANGVHVCRTRGLRSADLRPHADTLRTYADALGAAPLPAFARPPSMGPLTEGLLALEEACEHRLGAPARARERYVVSRRSCTHCGHTHGLTSVVEAPRPSKGPSDEAAEPWRVQVRTGYERLAQTLWRVAREFDVRGYGRVLRAKLTNAWCACGCSTDHLAEVCERSVQEEEEVRATARAAAERRAGTGSSGGKGGGMSAGVCTALAGGQGRSGKGKEREWDGRGAGVFGWGSADEEDVWEAPLDFGPAAPEGNVLGQDERDMSVGELMEWRYFKAEIAKEEGNAAFKKGEYERAIEHYERAVQAEPEMPHYQLNIAAAHLKLSNWLAAETACTAALSQHRSGKGHFRRARARRMLGRNDEAIKDLRAALRIHPSNAEALAELAALVPPMPPRMPSPEFEEGSSSHTSALPLSSSFSSASTPFSHSSRSHSSAASASSSAPTCDAAEDVRGTLQITFDTTAVTVPPKARRSVKQEKKTFVVPDWERYSVRRVGG